MSAGVLTPKHSGESLPGTVVTTCPKCRYVFAPSPEHLTDAIAQQRIAELEAQVSLLTSKATAAVDKLADYEDELRHLRTSSQDRNLRGLNSSSDIALSGPERSSDEQARPASSHTRASRFSSFLTGARKSVHSASQPPPLSRRESDLQAALAREQERRQQAEGKVTQMSTEIEELSVQLFQQANEMVAAERKARAKLEERVEQLERRDIEKRKRLEKLEERMKRIERVRVLLGT